METNGKFHGFPTSTSDTIWTLANEAVLWREGLPKAVNFITNANAPGKNLPIFLSATSAMEAINRLSLEGVKPLSLSRVMFCGLLADITNEVPHAIRFEGQQGFILDIRELFRLIAGGP